MDALYATIPTVQCRKQCQDCCGPIDMSARERERIRQRTGKDVGVGAAPSLLPDERGRLNVCLTCNMLTPAGECSVYDIRPVICRVFGVSESLKCPYGCRPNGPYLTDAETVEFLLEANRIGGDPNGATSRELTAMVAALRDPATLAALSLHMKRNRKHT
jgi:Fe-S-cluster containining protein